MLDIAGARGVPPDQVAIAWAASHASVPMIGTRTLDQLNSNLAALALVLSGEERARLDAASALQGAFLPAAAPQFEGGPPAGAMPVA